MFGFLDSSNKLVISDGLQQEVDGADLVAFEGIFLEGCGKNDLGTLGQHVREFHTIHVGHLDVHEGEVDGVFLQPAESLYAICKRRLQP